MPLPADAPPAPAPPTAVRPRCPRCGASLGRLTADAPGEDAGAADAGRYCGCCGLVVPGPAAAGAAAGAAAPGGR